MGRLRGCVALVIWAVGSGGCATVQEADSDAGEGTALDAALDPDVDAAPGPDVDSSPGRLADAASGAPDGASRPPVRYDVGYVDDFTLSPDINAVFGFVAVVNTGSEPLDLSTAEVVTYIDDRDDVVWTFTNEAGSTTLLEPGRAAGFLTPAARTMVLAEGVVTEPVDDEVLTFSMSLAATMAVDYRLQGQAVISIGGVTATLPLTVTVTEGAEFQVNSGRRIQAGL